MVDVGGALTRKLGPLPAWGWGVAVGGGLLVVKMVRGGSGTPRETLVVPTGSPMPSEDFASGLGTRLDEVSGRVDWLAQQVANNQSGTEVPSPTNRPPSAPNAARRSGLYVGRYLDFLRINEGKRAANRFLERIRRTGETRQAAVHRVTSHQYGDTRANQMLQFLLRRGGMDAARDFAKANRRAGETVAHAFNRLFGTPPTQVKPPSTTQ